MTKPWVGLAPATAYTGLGWQYTGMYTSGTTG